MLKLQIECLVTEEMRSLFREIGNQLLAVNPNAPLTAVRPVINDRMALVVFLLQYFIERNFKISKERTLGSFKETVDDWQAYVPDSNHKEIGFFILCRDQLFYVTAKLMQTIDADNRCSDCYCNR